MVKTTSEIDGL